MPKGPSPVIVPVAGGWSRGTARRVLTVLETSVMVFGTAVTILTSTAPFPSEPCVNSRLDVYSPIVRMRARPMAGPFVTFEENTGRTQVWPSKGTAEVVTIGR